MSEPLTIVVEGKPVGKGRPRFGNGRVYTDAQTEAYETHVGYIARREMAGRSPFKCPVVMQVMAYFEIPQSWSVLDRNRALVGQIRHTKKPDGDNLVKALADALNSIAYLDDKQIVRFEVEKRYGAKSFVVVTIKEIVGTYADQQEAA